MKIGIFDPYLDTLGGGERYMLTLAKCLAENHEVSLLWHENILKKAEVKFGLDLKNVKHNKNFFKNTGKIKRIKRAKEYDVIIVLSDGSIPFLPFTKTFIHLQAPLKEENTSLLNKSKAQFAERIIVNSSYTKKFVDQALKVESAILYPPIDVEKFSKSPKKENIIVSVGRYTPIPGGDFKKHNILIKAFKELVDEGLKNWEYNVVISALPQHQVHVDELEKKAKGYPVIIHREVNDKKIKELYEKSKIYWHGAGYGEDLDKNPQNAEHFGISIVEAMAARSIPIVFNAGGLKEVVEDKKTGYLWDTLDELKTETRNVIKDEVTRKKIAENAADKSNYFKNERFCKEVNKLLK